MSVDPLNRDAKEGPTRTRDRVLGVYIGVLAVILAICSLGGGNAAQDAMLHNVEAANTWSFFQAKNARRHAVRLHTDDLNIALKASPQMPEEARKLIETKLAEYAAQEKKLTSDPEKKEGLDELFAKGKDFEAQRDEALKRGPYFDYGQALLQIAIVLASVAIVSGGNLLLFPSILLGLLGVLATIGGFTLAFPIPFL